MPEENETTFTSANNFRSRPQTVKTNDDELKALFSPYPLGDDERDTRQ
jgi:hypothetical protein